MTRVLLSLVFLSALVGCSSGSKDSGNPEPPSDRYRLAVIPKGLTHEFWQSIHRGADRAAEDLSAAGKKVEILWDGPRKESDANEQINLIEQKARMGLHGLVLAPQERQQMVAPVERLARNNIPVVIIDSNLNNPDLYVKYVATNNYNGGALAARHLLKKLEQKGVKEPNLVLFRYQKGSESTEQREKGFLDQVEKERANGRRINVVSDSQYAGATVDTAEKAAGPMLAGLKDQGVDGIFAVNESATAGLLLALRGQDEIRQRALVMGFDTSKPLLQALREGKVIGLVSQNPYRMGYLGVWHLVKHLEGYDVGAGAKELSTGEVILTADRGDVDGKEVLHVDEDAAARLYDPARQPEQKIELPEYKKR